MTYTQTLLQHISTDSHIDSDVIRILEIAVSLSRHVNEDHNITYGEAEEPEPASTTTEDYEELPFAIVTTLESEHFEIIKTFETLSEAIAFANENEKTKVMKMNWNDGSSRLAYIKEV